MEPSVLTEQIPLTYSVQCGLALLKMSCAVNLWRIVSAAQWDEHGINAAWVKDVIPILKMHALIGIIMHFKL